MHTFEIVIAMLLGGVALAGFSRRIGAPYPALVALAGALIALIPNMPQVAMDPELALALFVAPVLVDAAFDSSVRDMKHNWRPIASLALGAVLLTVGTVAVLVRWMSPEIPWAAAVALGAIVAPPDAAAASAVLKNLRPPHRLLVILEGESLFNDASALLLYRFAVGVALSHSVSGWGMTPMILWMLVVSAILAVILAKISVAITTRIKDLPSVVIVQFCTTFGIWTLAEKLKLSAIITVVVFGISASRMVAHRVPPRIRIPAWAVWEVSVFTLNLLAFILIGFQIRPILDRATSEQRWEYLMIFGVVLAAVIVVRLVWVTGASVIGRSFFHSYRSTGTPAPHADGCASKEFVGLNLREATVVGWCGMRGTVTLAAALALPYEFPARDLILAVAFGITVGTLLLQGLTIRPLLLAFKLKDDGRVDREVSHGRVESLRAAMKATRECSTTEAEKFSRQRVELLLLRAESEHNKVDKNFTPSALELLPADVAHAVVDGSVEEIDIVYAAMTAQRRRLIEMREDGTIGDAAFQRLEEELDWAEMGRAHELRDS